MRTHLDRSSLTDSWTLSHGDWSLCCPVSTGFCHSPSPTAFSGFLCPTPTAVPLPTSGCVEISSPNPLPGFAPKQTKGSSACRTTYVVLQIIMVLTTRAKCLQKSGYCLLNDCAFTFCTTNVFDSFGCVMSQFQHVMHKLPNLTTLCIYLCGFQITTHSEAMHNVSTHQRTSILPITFHCLNCFSHAAREHMPKYCRTLDSPK